ncbi:hypothetical protein [Bacteroides clarus]|uniref:hypothetical protein n=1 Tax=Bacteroides clarus TaxID=626929 RepID=UPI00248DCB3D|nr:hypothetical protein [Bacteroides clarus]
MNNNYGHSQIFGRARCKMPMNIQFFAEPSGGDGGGAGDGGDGGDNGDGHENTPTVDELLAQLAQERATNAQNKAALDKALKEKGELTKNLRAKMSAEEQEAEAKKAADEAKDARIQELESKFRTMDYSKRYMGIGMDEKTAETLSELTGELSDADKFFSALDKFMKSKIKSAGEDAIQELIKKNPEIKSGTGDSEKNALAKEKAKEAAHRHTGANMDILKHYISGGMN